MNLWLTEDKGKYWATAHLDSSWYCGSFRRALRAVQKLCTEHKFRTLVFLTVREMRKWERIEDPALDEIQQPFIDYCTKRGLQFRVAPGVSAKHVWPVEKVAIKKLKKGETAPADNRIQVYTDGSCLGNPGYGGWGFWSRSGQGHGGDSDVTNNAMEIQAVIESLRHFRKHKPRAPLLIISDSRYVVNGCTTWRHKWEAVGFRGIANADRWRTLCREIALADVQFRWVKGHSGTVGNIKADELAGEAARAHRQRIEGRL